MTLDIIAHEAALATAAPKKEIVLDNCRALDDILAEQGGVCAISNTSWCIDINVSTLLESELGKIRPPATWLQVSREIPGPD